MEGGSASNSAGETMVGGGLPRELVGRRDSPRAKGSEGRREEKDERDAVISAPAGWSEAGAARAGSMGAAQGEQRVLPCSPRCDVVQAEWRRCAAEVRAAHPLARPVELSNS